MKQEGRIEKKKKRASRKNKLLIAELEAAIRNNQLKRPSPPNCGSMMIFSGCSDIDLSHQTNPSTPSLDGLHIPNNGAPLWH